MCIGSWETFKKCPIWEKGWEWRNSQISEAESHPVFSVSVFKKKTKKHIFSNTRLQGNYTTATLFFLEWAMFCFASMRYCINEVKIFQFLKSFIFICPLIILNESSCLSLWFTQIVSLFLCSVFHLCINVSILEANWLAWSLYIPSRSLLVFARHIGAAV